MERIYEDNSYTIVDESPGVSTWTWRMKWPQNYFWWVLLWIFSITDNHYNIWVRKTRNGANHLSFRWMWKQWGEHNNYNYFFVSIGIWRINYNYNYVRAFVRVKHNCLFLVGRNICIIENSTSSLPNWLIWMILNFSISKWYW